MAGTEGPHQLARAPRQKHETERKQGRTVLYIFTFERRQEQKQPEHIERSGDQKHAADDVKMSVARLVGTSSITHQFL